MRLPGGNYDVLCRQELFRRSYFLFLMGFCEEDYLADLRSYGSSYVFRGTKGHNYIDFLPERVRNVNQIVQKNSKRQTANLVRREGVYSVSFPSGQSLFSARNDMIWDP
jgi:hypothetical protein